NIYIDEFGIAYLAGCDGNNGGMVMIDVNDGANPTIEGLGPAVYAHDVYTRANKMYSSEIFAGRMSIYDVSDKNNIQVLGRQFTPSRFTHNVWLSDNSNVAYTTDERGNAPIAAYDVSDPTDIIELDRFRPLLTLGNGVIPHNVHVLNDWLIISYYTDGCIIVDASRPSNLIEVGNFDTFIGGDGTSRGIWGVYPFFSSGTILGTDITNGLFVFQPTYVRACFLEGSVIDTFRRTPLADVDISINTTELYDRTTGFDGKYATGLVTPGTYQVTYSKAGYQSKTVTVNLANGVVVTEDIELSPLGSTFSLSGNVIRRRDKAPIFNAEVILQNSSFTYKFLTDFSGQIQAQGIVAGTYNIYAGSWGYQTGFTVAVLDGITPSFQLQLEEGFQDEFVVDKGWTVEGNATTGIWERGEPIGTFSGQTPINPDEDNPTDLGVECFVTGNGGGGIGTDDVDNGATVLISPPMDLSAINEPTLNFDYWFANVDRDPPANDSLIVSVSNGQREVVLQRITNSTNAWVASPAFDLSNFIQITDNMQIKFTAIDVDPGHVTEAAIDVFRITSEAPLPVELVAFEGAVETAGNLLEWTTASEWNHDHFVLERSLDGQFFETVAKVPGHRNSQVTRQYSYMDGALLVKGLVYYRLKSVDLGGEFSYSSVIVLNRASADKGLNIELYPNPFNNFSTISYELPRDNYSARLSIYDVLGNELKSFELNAASGSLEVGADLMKGLYLVKIEGENEEHQVLRLIKQ
ncbi:MAG: carboxypeptidase regulatory-like domain-containing protein, partial [Bacteroidota bacterium]